MNKFPLSFSFQKEEEVVKNSRIHFITKWLLKFVSYLYKVYFDIAV